MRTHHCKIPIDLEWRTSINFAWDVRAFRNIDGATLTCWAVAFPWTIHYR